MNKSHQFLQPYCQDLSRKVARCKATKWLNVRSNIDIGPSEDTYSF